MVKASRARGTGTYGKPALTLDQLVDRLADRGLAIPDQERATRYLRHLGYYRLSPYTIPFQVIGADHQFRPDVAFDDVLDLYVFDRSLRLLVLDALERIEVAVRSALTDHMSLTYDDPTGTSILSTSATRANINVSSVRSRRRATSNWAVPPSSPATASCFVQLSSTTSPRTGPRSSRPLG